YAEGREDRTHCGRQKTGTQTNCITEEEIMFISDIVRRSGRSLRQAKVRTLLTAAAIGVGTFALTLTLAASNGAQSFVNRIISENFDPAELIVANDESLFGRGDTTKPKEYDSSYSNGQSNAGASIQ